MKAFEVNEVVVLQELQHINVNSMHLIFAGSCIRGLSFLPLSSVFQITSSILAFFRCNFSICKVGPSISSISLEFPKDDFFASTFLVISHCFQLFIPQQQQASSIVNNSPYQLFHTSNTLHLSQIVNAYECALNYRGSCLCR